MDLPDNASGLCDEDALWPVLAAAWDLVDERKDSNLAIKPLLSARIPLQTGNAGQEHGPNDVALVLATA